MRYVAFLRAINVGGHVVKMDRLRELFQSLKLRNVETFIASGNVIFDWRSEDTPALEQQIEKRLASALGYDVATFIRSMDELRAVAAYEPFTSVEGCALSIGFLKSAPSAEVRRKVLSLQSEIDEFHVHGRELYWLCRSKVSESKISGALLEKMFGMPSTVRNVTTVRRLAQKQ